MVLLLSCGRCSATIPISSRVAGSAIVVTMTAETFRLDAHVVDVLLRDLVGHDRSPASFLVYLLLWRRTRAQSPARPVRLSHRDIAEETGLSKSAVQQALRILHRRGLVKSKQQDQTDTPEHSVVRTWMRSARVELCPDCTGVQCENLSSVAHVERILRIATA